MTFRGPRVDPEFVKMQIPGAWSRLFELQPLTGQSKTQHFSQVPQEELDGGPIWKITDVRKREPKFRICTGLGKVPAKSRPPWNLRM